MKTKKTMHVAMITTIRLVLGGVFIWAGLTKISDPSAFAQAVRAYHILPEAFVSPFAVFVPWIEVVAGVALVLGMWTQSSALICLMLLFSFEIALGVNIYRGADFSCGCFGLDGSGNSLLFAMTLDFFLLLGAAVLVFARSVPLSFDGFRVRRAGVVQARRDSTFAV